MVDGTNRNDSGIVPIVRAAGSQHVRAGRFDLTATRHEPRLRLRPHAHDRCALCFVVRGSVTQRFRLGRVQEGVPTSLLIVPAGETHTTQFHRAGERSLILELDPAHFSDTSEIARLVDQPHVIRGAAVSEFARAAEWECAHADGLTPLAIEALGLDLLAGLSRGSGHLPARPAPAWLVRAIDRLHTEFSHPPSLTLLAQDAGVHPVHLARTFRRHVGSTIGTCIRHVRIDVARRWLCDSRRSMTSIALDLGFADQSHFARAFRRTVGVTPSQYRSRTRPSR